MSVSNVLCHKKRRFISHPSCRSTVRSYALMSVFFTGDRNSVNELHIQWGTKDTYSLHRTTISRKVVRIARCPTPAKLARKTIYPNIPLEPPPPPAYLKTAHTRRRWWHRFSGWRRNDAGSFAPKRLASLKKKWRLGRMEREECRAGRTARLVCRFLSTLALASRLLQPCYSWNRIWNLP